jgi:hypothetical protein
VIVETRTQFGGRGLTRRFPRRDGDIDRGEGILVQAKGLSCKAFDAIACDGSAEGSRRNAQAQARTGFMIGQDRQTKICVGKFFAMPLDCAKFGRLV